MINSIVPLIVLLIIGREMYTGHNSAYLNNCKKKQFNNVNLNKSFNYII